MAISLNVYLVTDGNGREAVDFYKKAFGAEVLALQTFGDGPSNPDHPVPPEAKDRIMHASLQIGSSVLMLSDTFPGMPYVVGNHVNVTVNTDTAEEAKEIFNQLQDGGEVTMPIQETFWSPAYGMVTDKFGVHFQISCVAANHQ
ncbi:MULTISPECIES: VOC family protein [Paenibacillus]|jgi:PhnB protein|uniref:VOC family protein n=1 Tax=Paenibacillus TaxID=44249 RepID=UPI00041AE9BC|nr:MULTISPECIES: VOC family protein [Paenibacillus]KGP83758.1 3-demethylubiquinone-9 3-methyltransferase [Paenibacillus sp. MAEPY2]KGP87473.1 3-demethylubiquinone-9 3-methyltransferase [Paenibacillus sp. MAEPY1]OZQ65588.1 VOC family protein [Paenibacillus taichungensis]HBU85130.1 VOC family protein [Paenibacillus sp.]